MFLFKKNFLLRGLFFIFFLSALQANASDDSCEKSLRSGLDPSSIQLLKSNEFWETAHFEKLLPIIDPTILESDESPDELLSAFNLSRAPLQKLFESLGNLFLGDEAFVVQFYKSMPAAAKVRIDSPLFSGFPSGATRWKVLEAFVVNKMLLRGDPRSASNLILSHTELPNWRDQGTLDHNVWKLPWFQVSTQAKIPGLIHLPLVNLHLLYERLGKGRTLPAYLRPVLELYFLSHTIQPQSNETETKLAYSELPEKYKVWAIKSMNSTDQGEQALGQSSSAPTLFERSNIQTPKIKPRKGEWSTEFIETAIQAGREAWIYYTKSTPSTETPQNEEFLRSMLFPSDYWIYQKGMKFAFTKIQEDTTLEKREIQSTLYEDVEYAYRELKALRARTLLSSDQVKKESNTWNLSPNERARLIKQESQHSTTQWNFAIEEAISRFAGARLRAALLAYLSRLQIHPKYWRIHDLEPRIQTATAQLLIAAEKEQNEERNKAELEAFKNALPPDVRDDLFLINPMKHPLGKKNIESYRARNIKDKTLVWSAKTVKFMGVTATIALLLNNASQWSERIFPTPPLTSADVYKLSEPKSFDPNTMLTDNEFQLEKFNFIRKVMSVGLDPADQRLLSEFVKNTNPTNVPLPLRAAFIRLKEHKKTDPEYGDFDYFENWHGNSKHTLNGYERIVSPELAKRRANWLHLTINIYRVVTWRAAAARNQLDTEIQADLAPEVRDDIKRLNKARLQALEAQQFSNTNGNKAEVHTNSTSKVQ